MALSLEYEHERAESTKSEKFGLSNITMMLLPVVSLWETLTVQSQYIFVWNEIDHNHLINQVVEYPTKVPTQPQELRCDGQSLYFVPPKWDGGGRILEYKVWTILVIRQRSPVFGVYSSKFSIQLIYKVQLKPVDGQHFLVFKVVPVLYLSEWPNLEDNFFGDLGGE